MSLTSAIKSLVLGPDTATPKTPTKVGPQFPDAEQHDRAIFKLRNAVDAARERGEQARQQHAETAARCAELQSRFDAGDDTLTDELLAARAFVERSSLYKERADKALVAAQQELSEADRARTAAHIAHLDQVFKSLPTRLIADVTPLLDSLVALAVRVDAVSKKLVAEAEFAAAESRKLKATLGQPSMDSSHDRRQASEAAALPARIFENKLNAKRDVTQWMRML